MKPMGTWLAPEVAASPSRATSDAVSKPSPKSSPSGYMCQLLLMARSMGRKIRARSPRSFRNSSRVASL